MIKIMREPLTIFLILVLTVCIFSAGCVQSSGNSTVTTAVLQANVSTPDPATPVPVTIATSAPYEVVTVIRYVSPPRVAKDSYLLFTLEVPGEWNVSTYRMMKSDTSDYRTELVAGNVFSIYSYFITPSREQDYRDRFRQWIPAPVEKTVTINNIRYDRFESRANGNTSVAYIAHSNSANEHGYASVLVFTARDSNRFEREDFEAVVSSFRYFSAKSAGTIPGNEIPVYDLSGNAVYRSLDPRLFNSSEGGGGDMSSSDTGTSGGGSSDGGSSGGGGCNSGSWSWE
jgi:uncharacterized membrane protein YgcG